MEEMKRELEFKDHTLEYTHNILIKSEKAKIELEQEKKMLEERIERGDYSFDREDEINDFYEDKIHELEGRVR